MGDFALQNRYLAGRLIYRAVMAGEAQFAGFEFCGESPATRLMP